MDDAQSGRSSCRPLLTLTLALLIAYAAAPAAWAWEPDVTAPEAALETFHDHFSAAAYPYARHSAKPLGVVGFDVWAEAAVAPDFEDEVRDALTDGIPAGYLTVYRVGARKGLPWGIDVGASWGKALDSDLDLLNAEVSWAILDGGAVSPAFGVRITGGRGSGGAYDLEQYGAEVLLSKGFAVLTPYAGAGVSWSESTFERPTGDFTVDSSRGFVYGGVILNLWVPKISFEVEQAETLQGAVRIALGL
jgi:hypothetical protein